MALEKAEKCPACGHDLVVIAMLVDNTNVEMASCQTCDTRSWRQYGQPIDLSDALTEVGHHSGRRR